MTSMTTSDETRKYCAREVVGVLAAPNELERAIDDLELAGFDRADISVLATDGKLKERIGHLYRSVADVVDDGKTPQTAFASRESRIEGEAAAVGVPFQIGGFAGAAAVVAAGGTLAAAIAALILGGALAGGVGALLALAVARRHAESVREQLALGGLVLWVRTPDETSEKRAFAVLQKSGAKLVHVHSIEREWGPKDRSFQFDPFLEPDPKPA